jgi:hypothetical protein
MRYLAVTLALLATTTGSSPLVAQQRSCAGTRLPKLLPPPGALLDSAKALADFASLVGAHDQMLFSLRYLENDSLPSVRMLEGANMQAALILSRSLRPQSPSGLRAVRVRVTGGASPTLTIERSTYCPPVPEPRADGGYPSAVLVQIQPGDRVPTGRARVALELLVAETGQVLRSKLIESSGMTDFDEQITREFETRRFRPALLDGLPIPGVYRTDGQSPRL